MTEQEVFTQQEESKHLPIPQSRRVAIKTPQGQQKIHFQETKDNNENNKEEDDDEEDGGIFFEEVLSDNQDPSLT